VKRKNARVKEKMSFGSKDWKVTSSSSSSSSSQGTCYAIRHDGHSSDLATAWRSERHV